MATEPVIQQPANRHYVFARRCTNDFGHFAVGERARGAFPPELVASYLAAGVLVDAPAAPAPVTAAKGGRRGRHAQAR